ncbi:hypothetical protein [Haloferula sp. BvORR071]|uniref:hypothetical protein n=1 Tax=Haloferula sp. BvORR071 TaxID=1396141 RepID=UPI000555216F|nr:hypothetical protein [Haloferula sp. BvORR071]
MKSTALLLVVASQPLLAVSVPQAANFAKSNTGDLYQGYGSSQLVANNDGFFTATFQPFNSSLGTLKSFAIQCVLNGKMVGSVGTDTDSAAVSASLGGAFAIDGNTCTGTGGGGGSLDNLIFTGEPIDVPFAIQPFEQVFQVAQSGMMYNPALLTSVNGSGPITLTFNSGVKVDYLNVTDLAANFTATISMIYNYDAAAGAESLKITKLIRNGAEEKVTIEWTSASGTTYAIDASSTPGGWDTIATGVAASTEGPTTSFVEQNVPATVTRRFYRVREEE